MPAPTDDLAHLLRRCGYLTTPGVMAAWQGLELTQAVDRVLDFSVNPADTFIPPSATTATDIRRYWLDRMASVPAPLQERLAFFWHGHFATGFNKISDVQNSPAPVMLAQNRVFRTLGAGSFLTLTKAVAADAAMLLYLDNQNNNNGRPNENFARELMELFTLGVDQGYTQTDVVDVARAWTGHGVATPTSGAGVYSFNPARHDNGNKTIFGITRNWNGPEVIDEIVTGSRQMICARYIAEKLWSHFAHPNPTSGLLDSLSAVFIASGMDVGALLRDMFLRAEFYSPVAKQTLVRTPTEWSVALHRATGLQAATTAIEGTLSDMGHTPFEPPNVAGWKQNEFWLTENNVWLKDEAARAIANRAITAGFITDYLTLTTPQLVQRGFDLFGLTTVSPQTRSTIETWVTAHRTANASNLRYHLLRLIAISPEFGLA